MNEIFYAIEKDFNEFMKEAKDFCEKYKNNQIESLEIMRLAKEIAEGER